MATFEQKQHDFLKTVFEKIGNFRHWITSLDVVKTNEEALKAVEEWLRDDPASEVRVHYRLLNDLNQVVFQLKADLDVDNKTQLDTFIVDCLTTLRMGFKLPVDKLNEKDHARLSRYMEYFIKAVFTARQMKLVISSFSLPEEPPKKDAEPQTVESVSPGDHALEPTPDSSSLPESPLASSILVLPEGPIYDVAPGSDDLVPYQVLSSGSLVKGSLLGHSQGQSNQSSRKRPASDLIPSTLGELAAQQEKKKRKPYQTKTKQLQEEIQQMKEQRQRLYEKEQELDKLMKNVRGQLSSQHSPQTTQMVLVHRDSLPLRPTSHEQPSRIPE